MNNEKDAGIDIQTMVDEVVGDQLDELNVQRKTALSFCQDGKVFFTKLLCFNNNEYNCVHVKIRIDRGGIRHYCGRVENKRVQDKIEPRDNYDV